MKIITVVFVTTYVTAVIVVDIMIVVTSYGLTRVKKSVMRCRWRTMMIYAVVSALRMPPSP